MSEPAPAAVEAESTRPLVRRIIHETSRFAMLQIVAAALGWVANIGLARLLDRRDFGVFGIATFYIGLGNLLGSGGLGATLLRRKAEASRAEYQSTVSAMLAVSFVFAVLLFVLAPWIGRTNGFSESEVVVLRAMAPLYFMGALRIIPYVRLERDFSFSTIARIELAAALLRHLVALTVAAAFGSVWALVLSQFAAALLQLALAYRASPGWVGLGFSWPAFRPLLAYGSKIQSLSICAYFKDNISRSLLGATTGPSSVGLFDFAISYIQIPVVAVNSLARVQLPIYARLERDDPALHSALRGALRMALLLGVPLLVLLALAGPWLVSVIYGDKWLPSVPIARALLINMACGLLTSPLLTLLQGQGRAGLALITFGLWTLGTWALALIAVGIDPHALTAVGYAHSATTLVITLYLLGWAARHLGRPILPDLAAPVASGMLAFAIPTAAAHFAGGILAHPLSLGLGSLVCYLLTLAALDGRRVLSEARALLTTIVQPKRPSESPAQPPA
jgi:PST family polysaccharide transporter